MTQQERISEIILQLKQIRKERDLSLQDVHELVIAAGYYLSLSSVKRVFADGSEKQNFRYQDTIQPIVRVLLGVTEETPENNDITANEIDALKNVILLKDSIIGELRTENEVLSAKNEKLEKETQRQSEELQVLREDSKQRIDYLLAQIAAIRNSLDQEMARVHDEYKDDILFYKEQINLLRDQLRRKDEQVDRKDRYIDILIETARKGGDLTKLGKIPD